MKSEKDLFKAEHYLKNRWAKQINYTKNDNRETASNAYSQAYQSNNIFPNRNFKIQEGLEYWYICLSMYHVSKCVSMWKSLF